MIDVQDPAGTTAQGLAEVSIAGRGLYALEFLLFDDEISGRDDPAYRCALVQAITADIADNAAAILAELAALLSVNAPKVQAGLERGFRTSLRLAERLDDPVFAGAATQQGWFRVEVLQSSIDQIRTIASTDPGPALGVAAGFNSLDGD